MQAIAITEKVFTVLQEITDYWGSKAIIISYQDYDDLPQIVEFKGVKFARLSFNSDYHTAIYSVHSYQYKAKGV